MRSSSMRPASTCRDGGAGRVNRQQVKKLLGTPRALE